VVRPHERVRAARNATEGALEAQQPGVARRDADRAPAVATGCQRDQPAGNGCRRATRRAADGAAVPPRVVRDAVDLGNADVEAAELARRRLADRHDATPLAQPLDDVRRERADAVLERQRRFGVRPAFDGLELLDPGRHTAERQRHIGRCRGGAGPIDVDVTERVQLRRADRGERRLQLFDRTALAAAERVDERARIALPRGICHGLSLAEVARPWRRRSAPHGAASPSGSPKRR
jgi:hypothetical protein